MIDLIRRSFGRDRSQEPDHNEVREKIRSKRKDIAKTMSMLDWNTTSEAGKVVLSLEGLSEDWSDFVPGMRCKILDISPCKDVTAVLCEVLYPFEMEAHWHIESETTLCLNTPMIDTITGQETKRGFSTRWKPNEIHRPKFPEAGFIIVIFDPALTKE